MIKISVIIPTFNSGKLIEHCLDTVFAQDYPYLEVIIVDNGSMDNTVNLVEKTYPQVRLIENRENLGAAKARNQGIGLASGNWVLTLDCDISLTPDFFRKMERFLEESEDHIGILQPKILRQDGKAIYSCGIYLSKLRRFYDIGRGKFDNSQFNVSKYVFGACSAAAVYKREMLEEIKEGTGYFDERFFFLVEDVDLAWRAQRKGWKALFYPQVICYHIGNSSGTSKMLRQYLCWRNRKILLSKWRLNRFKLAFICLFYDLPRLVFLFIANSYVRNEILNEIKEI